MKLKKLLINTSICFVLLSMLSVPLMSYYAAEVTTQDTTDYTVSKSTLENYKAGWIPDEYDRIGVTSDDSIFGLPVKYDPRSDNFLTDTKDQGNTFLCWMYASAGAVEQYV